MACSLLITVLNECYKYSFSTITPYSLVAATEGNMQDLAFVLPCPFYHRVENPGSRISKIGLKMLFFSFLLVH